ncbi:hypothetical protein NCCP2495_07910 [Dietzia sp. NCCP-2495]|nr:hypothetical protein NCCP2495_07910 [Dietzia sp. NCCP-2495]
MARNRPDGGGLGIPGRPVAGAAPGPLALVVNLGSEPCRVPVSGEAVLTSGAEVVAGSQDATDSVSCRPFGFAVVRTLQR